MFEDDDSPKDVYNDLSRNNYWVDTSLRAKFFFLDATFIGPLSVFLIKIHIYTFFVLLFTTVIYAILAVFNITFRGLIDRVGAFLFNYKRIK